MITTVYLIVSSEGSVIAVYSTADTAALVVDRYNTDPFIDGEPDLHAPYHVETWNVQQYPPSSCLDTKPQPR